MTRPTHARPRRLIAVNRFYRPDHAATAQLLTDLAEDLARRGVAVTVLTSRLQYEGGAPLPARERLAGVEVRRLWTTRFGRGNLVGRLIDYASFYLGATLALLAQARREDVILAKTDPPLISVAAALVARLKGAVLVNWCQDLFPEIAAALGQGWARGPAGAALAALRTWSLRTARLNAALHANMQTKLAAFGAPPAQIQVLPNWADADIRPIPRPANPLRAAWGLQDRFVIAYSGNLGRAHLPERVAALVAATRDIPGLAWLFIGGGAGLAPVRAAATGAANVQFQPYQPRSRLSESLSAADLHLVSLDPTCEGLIVPSKLYGVLAAGRPILAFGAADGAAAQIAAGLSGSLVLDPDQPQHWVQRLAATVAAGPIANNPAPSTGLAAWRAALLALLRP